MVGVSRQGLSARYPHGDVMALTELQIRKASPKEQQYKLYDQGGLLLLVRPTGGKFWRLKYRHNGKEQSLSLGEYPGTGLKEARGKRDAARKLLSDGKDPAYEKRLQELERAQSAANTFGIIAEELIAKAEKEGRATATLTKARWFLALMPKNFTARPVKDITAPELLAVLKKIEDAGHYETARRVRAFAGRVFRYGIATGRALRDPSQDLRGALITPKVTHHAAILEPERVSRSPNRTSRQGLRSPMKAMSTSSKRKPLSSLCARLIVRATSATAMTCSLPFVSAVCSFSKVSGMGSRGKSVKILPKTY